VYAHAFAMLPNLDNFIAKFAPTYATDPEYANKLHSIINQHALKQYDTHD
jgi:flagellum-specific peptidoglycan hydrolase FlgJ